MSAGWTDLGGAMAWVAGGLAVVAAVIGFLIWDARRRGRGNVLVLVAWTAARLWLAMCLLGAVIAIWRWLADGDLSVPGLPVSLAWPESLPCDQAAPSESAEPTLWCAHVSTADASITGLDSGTRALLALGELLGIVLAASPALLVAIVCGEAMKGAPFSRTVGRWMLITAVVVLVAGVGGNLATEIGRELAAAAVLPPPDSGAAVTTTGYPRLDVALWPIGAALALGALGAVFRHGAVLQRETEGLV